MKKWNHFLCPALVCAGFLFSSGCATSTLQGTPAQLQAQPGAKEYPVAMVHAGNASYLLFGCLPILTGNPNRPNTKDYDFFCDSATAEDNMQMLKMSLKKYDGDRLDNVKTTIRRNGWHTLGLLWTKVVLSEAVVVREIKE